MPCWHFFYAFQFVCSKLDVSQIAIYARHLINIGAKGVYILGTTGEGLSLSLDEKLAVIRAWKEALSAITDGKLITIVHVTSTVMSEMKVLAEEVAKLEMDAIAVLPSLYYKNPTIEWSIDYLKCIAEVAPEIPLYYYYSPGATGQLACKFSVPLFQDS